MKIALIGQDLVGQGVQFATAMMARAFSAHGYEVEIVVSKVHTDLVASGQKAFDVPHDVRWVFMPSRRSSRNWYFLRRYLKTSGVDVVIAETRHYAAVLAFASFGLSSIPKLYQVEHINVPQLPLKSFHRFKVLLQQYLLYRRFSGIMTVNDESRRRLLDRTRWVGKRLRIKTVYNAVVDDDFIEKRACPSTHPWLIEKQYPVFVAAGALHECKGYMDLLAAMKQVNKSHHVRLVVFGRGEQERQLLEYVKENNLQDVVSIAGYADNLPAELKSADGFISASKAESFSIVIAQALALGVPCISTDAPLGPREVLGNGRYGRLVPVGDIDALAQAICDYVENPPDKPSPESWERFTIFNVLRNYLDAMGVLVDSGYKLQGVK